MMTLNNLFKKIITMMLWCIIIIPIVNAIQSTQQYNKIYLEPFYREVLSANTNYNYTLNINPPDKISSVLSAIITFNTQINGQSQNFTLLVNNKSCNNPSYYIATAFSTTGNTQLYFDCSNIITSSGIYNIVLRSSVNTGLINGWIDLTYMNNPIGEVFLHGTEYTPNEQGKMFLQFLDSNKQPINNSACTISVWYPNNTRLVNSSSMSYLDDGIYYYNLNIPSSIGVYPASAKCYYPYQFGSINISNNVTESWDSNSFTGGSGWAYSSINNSINGWDYYSVNIVTNATASGCYDGNYCARIEGVSQSAQYLERGFITPANTQSMVITFWLKSTMGVSDTAEYDIFDGNFHTMEVYSGANFLPNVWYKKQYNFTTSQGYYLDSTAILQGFYAISWTASNKYLYVDNISVSYIVSNTTISNVSSYQVLMGSGEIHVSNLYNSLNNSISSVTPEQMWNYTNRTLTQSAINYTQVGVSVWNSTTRNLTYYPSQADLTNYTLIQNNQYNYTNRFNAIDGALNTINTTLLSVNQSLSLNINNIPINVWSYNTRNLTYYQNFTQLQVDLTNYTLITNNVWSFNNRTLTSFIFDNTNYTLIINSLNDTASINNLNNQILAINNSIINRINIVASDVWIYSNRNLTYYQNFTQPQSDLTNYSKIVLDVWSYNNRTLTYYQVNNISVSDIWNYINRTLTYYEVNNISKTDIWTYNNRTLTFYPSQIDLTNYTLIQNNQYNYTPRFNTIDTSLNTINNTIYSVNNSLYNRIVSSESLLSSLINSINISIISEILNIPFSVWSFNSRNLTYYEHTDMTNYTLIRDNQYNYTQRFDSIDSSINQLNYSISQEFSAIPSNVWNYNTRNLTYYQNFTQEQLDMTNYTLIQSNQYNYTSRFDSLDAVILYINNSIISSINDVPLNVWIYNNRTLTYYENFTQEQLDMTNYTLITDNVWSYNNRTLTYYEINNISASDVWSYINRTLTYYDINNISVSDVWSYYNRTLTYYPQQLDLTNYSLISENVWSYNNRTLTYYIVNNISVSDIWTYTIRNLTYYEINNISTSDIWMYNNRSLTYYPMQLDMTNYSAITSGVWEYNNRNLTFYPTQLDLTNYSLITENVWNYNNRSLTYYELNNITPSDVWNYINRTLTYYEVNNISSSDIWYYNNRTLTYYPSSQDLTNYTLITDNVWNYTARYTHGVILN